MNKLLKIRLLAVCLLLAGLLAAQEQTPFWNEIQAFKKKDSIQPPAKGQILFVGSSSFTKWTDVQEYFPGYPILNRGFGGSSLPDVIRYADDIIFPYQPKQVVIYCGENDLAMADTVTATMVLQRFETLFIMIREKLPEIPVVFVSLKPSPSRAHLFSKMEEANLAIRDYLENKKKTAFVDVYHKMLEEDGKPMGDLFISDNLHMNAKGYAIWQKLIEPQLLK